MSKISLSPDASGTGIFTIASPNSNTNRTLTLPDDTGTIVTNSGNQAGSFTTLNTSGQVVFNDSGADVDFRVEGDTDANLLFVDAGNDKFGVGTNDPFGKLDVRTTSAGSEAFAGVFANEGTTSGSKVSISLVSGGDGVAGRIRSQIVGDSDGTNNGYLAFNTRNAGTNTESMRIDSSGNVGIGTSSPVSYAKLTIAGAVKLNSISSAITTFPSGATTIYYQNTSLADDHSAVYIVGPSGFVYSSCKVDIVVTNGATVETTATVWTDVQETTVTSANLGGINSTNIDVVNGTTGTDGKFNILLNGQSGNSYIALRNRMGGTRRVYVTVTVISAR